MVNLFAPIDNVVGGLAGSLGKPEDQVRLILALTYQVV